MGLFSSIVGGLISGGFSMASNELQRQREEAARAENYRYNEMAAENADARTRALYNDLQSPEALLRQYQSAGLSPSMMFGSGGGTGAQPSSGAQGEGANGIQPKTYGIDPLQGAQLGLMEAQIKKTEAETANIDRDTQLKALEQEVKEFENSTFKDNWRIINSTFKNEKGETTSIFELAQEHYKYDEFLNAVRKYLPENLTSTEVGQKTLRDIFYASNMLNTDISVLSNNKVSADFQKQITNALKTIDFANKNAEAILGDLRKQIATNDLDERERKAWTDLLDKLGKKGSTAQDIAIVLGLVVKQFLGKANLNVKAGK